MEDRKRIEKVANLLLEEMGVDCCATPQVISILSQYPYRVLVRPLVSKMRVEGKTQEQIAISLGITVRTVQWILSKD